MTVNKLKEIVYGPPAERLSSDDTYGQAQINKSNDWLEKHSSLDKKELSEEWLKEFSDWGFTSNNREYYWETLGEISPLDNEKFKDFTVEDIRKTIDAFPTLEDKENYFRDNASTWPSYVLDSLSGYFTNIRGANAGKDLERNRLGQIMEMRQVLKEKNFKLNPNVSIESHTEEMIKGYDMGYRNEIEVNEEGRLSIPLDGEQVALYTIPELPLSMEESFISLNDLRGVVKDSFKPMLDTSRKEQNRIERRTKKALLNRIKTGEIPKEFRSNVIIDGVLEDKDPAASAKIILLEGIKKKMKSNAYPSIKDMYMDYKNQYLDLMDKLKRRLEDGSYS